MLKKILLTSAAFSMFSLLSFANPVSCTKEDPPDKCGKGMTCYLVKGECIKLNSLENGSACKKHDVCSSNWCNPAVNKCEVKK